MIHKGNCDISSMGICTCKNTQKTDCERHGVQYSVKGRCPKCPTVEYTPPSLPNWENRFNDEFPGMQFGYDGELVKSFIRQVEQKAREEERERVLGIVEDMKMDLELLNGAKMNGKFKRLDMKESIGWNKALSDLTTQLKEALKE